MNDMEFANYEPIPMINVWTSGIVLCIQAPLGIRMDTEAFGWEVFNHDEVEEITGPDAHGVYTITFKVKKKGYLLSEIQDMASWLRRTMIKHLATADLVQEVVWVDDE